MRLRIKKIAIANRGEIAVRIARACKEMAIKTLGVYSEADRQATHIFHCDEAVCIGPPPAAESYLNQDRIISAALTSGCDALHPGYGFLAENAGFAEKCSDAGLVFIGPAPDAMRMMGDKIQARQTVAKAGVPVIPGSKRGFKSLAPMVKEAEQIRYPVLIKAALGGGGKGMRVCRNSKDLKDGFSLCHSEAQSAFSDPTLYLEKYIERPRHIEFQIIADQYGNMIHLGERECSIQRRHQKLIEEAPSSVLDGTLRETMGKAALAASASVGYINAGTIEFLLDENRQFYFLEMNTRLQVEHPVTEMITGVDLVCEQIRIAAGQKLKYKQEDAVACGHAVECRIYAEDPDNNFLPSCGRLDKLVEPAGPGIRVDSGVREGDEIPVFYDPLIAKLIAWAPDRRMAIQRMHRALSEYQIHGVRTTTGFLKRVMNDNRFLMGDFNTHFIDESGTQGDHYSETDIMKAGISSALVYHLSHENVHMSQEKKGGSPWKWLGRREAHR